MNGGKPFQLRAYPISWSWGFINQHKRHMQSIGLRQHGILAAVAAVIVALHPSAVSEAAGPARPREIRDCAECPVMVVLPAGSFVMGAPAREKGRGADEGPVHRVTFGSPFAVGKYEVTFDEWAACERDGACPVVNDQGWGQTRPAMNVNHEDAVRYVEWLAAKTGRPYRLLSEAEWEYAARAGSRKARYWGDSPRRACEFSNVLDQSVPSGYSWAPSNCRDGQGNTAPVGSFKANAFGLHDMLGNVWEWVADCWNDSYVGAPVDGSAWTTGDCSQRVIRGGSWIDPAEDMRSANRTRLLPQTRYDFLGFRVGLTLP
jgi:formylglycine-generating enzyme required for sulfatase activity